MVEAYRVVVDGRGGRTYSSMMSADAVARSYARFGTYCTLEWRRRPGALWALITIYEPRGHGNFAVVNPHAEVVQ